MWRMLETAERDGKVRMVREKRRLSVMGSWKTPARAKTKAMMMLVKIMLARMMMVCGRERTDRLEGLYAHGGGG